MAGVATTVAALAHEPAASAGEEPVAIAVATASADAAAGRAAPARVLPPDRVGELAQAALDAIPGVMPQHGRLETPAPAASPSSAELSARRQQVAVSASRSGQRSGVGLSVWPAGGALSGTFGEHRGSHRHAGIDLDAGYGSAVVASGSGTVVAAGWASSAYAGYGMIVIIDHGNGVQTLSAHLSSVSVGVGQVVAPGERVGAVGNTGQSTGPHLHFEVRVGGVAVDPLRWLPAR